MLKGSLALSAALVMCFTPASAQERKELPHSAGMPPDQTKLCVPRTGAYTEAYCLTGLEGLSHSASVCFDDNPNFKSTAAFSEYLGSSSFGFGEQYGGEGVSSCIEYCNNMFGEKCKTKVRPRQR